MQVVRVRATFGGRLMVATGIGYVVAALLIGGVIVAFFFDFEERRDVAHMSNEERMAALGRVVASARRRNG